MGRPRARAWHPAAAKALPRRDAGHASWPPLAEFPCRRGKTGPYRQFARPAEPMEQARLKRVKGISIHPDVRPLPGEAVIATGDELHRYCRQKGILFLFYVGFNTNACILLRDYGTIEMGKRGYEVVLVRDCTTGMESFETTDQLWQTRCAIQFLEMFGKYSITSDELIHAACRRRRTLTLLQLASKDGDRTGRLTSSGPSGAGRALRSNTRRRIQDGRRWVSRPDGTRSRSPSGEAGPRA